MRQTLVVGFLLALVGTARADVAAGRKLLTIGDYAGAEAAAKATPGPDGKVLLAEVWRKTGRYVEARKILEEVAKDKKQLRARVQLGLVDQDVGDDVAAAKVWNALFDDHDAGRLDEKKADTLLYLAIAARYLRDIHGANDTLREAVDKDAKLVEADLEWGALFLDEYNAGDAEASFAEVLKVDPKNPDAHAGLARAKVDGTYDVPGALAEVDAALAVNPRHTGALLVRAQLQIDNDEYDAAKKTLAAVLAVNPNDTSAHAYLATIAFLADDTAGYDAERKRAFATNPKFARFFHIVAEFAVKEHRYKESIALELEALKIDPKDYTALAALGAGYLRMGDETDGMKALDEAAAGDKFNVRTYNLLTLFEDTIPKKYEMVEYSKVFRFRMPKAERAELERYVPRTLDRAWADMVKRYGFVPKTPVTIEMFDDPDHYSVRTVGLPNLGALAVCFGQLITSLAPSNGNLNWGMILWHELGHVFAIQLSNGRVPRWFTEGLSEYETLTARKEWRRQNDVDIWAAYSSGQLPSVLELNSRFLRAKNMMDMVVAYHMSSVAIEFIVRRWGFPKIVEALKLYGKGKDTAFVLPAITGLSIADFDKEFRKYLDERLAPYKGTFRVALGDYSDLTSFEKAAAAKPNDADALGNLALAELVAENPDAANARAADALRGDQRNKQALYVRAELAGQGANPEVAMAAWHALIDAGGDGYQARLELGKLALAKDDLAKAVPELEMAKKLDPERSEPYMLLAQAYDKHQREDDALKELERYVTIEKMEYAPVKRLVDKYAERKAWAKVREFGELALFINPEDADLHVAMGEAYAQTGSPADAIYEYQSALLADPPLRRPAIAQLGLANVYLAQHDQAAAKAAVGEALKLEPENAAGLELAKKVGK